ncbi:helix-turn-helix domain-containing protein [Streptomyces sp. K1PA1]|uniref:Helix-turn-helix domain-containing protein n=1 Tax=Streptomyces tropicalis TaxID=3034234 RepID=A0ABT6ACW1_9ACTN|nr:helix-turn-helix domain-containing protein [Streptomyces tropicalis]
MERFERGERNRDIAAALRVSERSVERWRRQWRERGRGWSPVEGLTRAAEGSSPRERR